MLLLSSAGFYPNQLFFKISLRNTFRVTNSLDPIRPDVLLGMSWFQTVCKAAGDTIRLIVTM